MCEVTVRHAPLHFRQQNLGLCLLRQLASWEESRLGSQRLLVIFGAL